jgi:hypothetical protein
MQKDGLLPLNQHALQVIGDVTYHDYEGSARSPEERARFLADLGIATSWFYAITAC